MFLFKKKKKEALFNKTFEATLIHLLHYLPALCRFGDHKQVTEADKTSIFQQ